MANGISDNMSDPESDSIDSHPVLSVADLGMPSLTQLQLRQNYHRRDAANERSLKPTRATPAGSSGLATPILYATRVPADADFLTSQIEALEHALADAQLRIKQPDGQGGDEIDRGERGEGDVSDRILDDGESVSEPEGHGKDEKGDGAPDVATCVSASGEHDDHVGDVSLVPAASTSNELAASWCDTDTQRRLAALEDTLSASRLREATLMASLRHVKDALLQQQISGTTATETSASADTSLGTAWGQQTQRWGRNGQLVAPATRPLTLAAQRLNHVREGMMIAEKAMSEIESFHGYHNQVSGFILSTTAERPNTTAAPSPWRTLRTT